MATACLGGVLLAACATPLAPTPSPTPASRPDTGGWVTARVEQPTEIQAAATDHPAFCSPCHPIVGSYISAIVSTPRSYVALGYLSPPAQAVAWTSDDGNDWRRVPDFPAGENSLVLAATGDAGGVVAVGSMGKDAAVWRSVNGSTWSRSALPLGKDADATSARATAVVRAPTGFVAAGYVETSGGRQPVFWRSLDGANWTRSATPSGSGNEVTGLAAGAGAIVAVGIDGDERTGTAAVWSSRNDGVTWETLDSPAFSTGRMLAAAVQGSQFVAVGETADETGAVAWTSIDGRHWAVAPAQPAFANGGQEIVMTAVSSTGSSFVAVGWKSDAANGSAVVWRSSDGQRWSIVPAALSFSGGGMSAVNTDNGVVVAGTIGWPDTHAAQVWLLDSP